jgi:hypothetical protein
MRPDTYAVFASVRGNRLDGPPFGIVAKVDRDVSDFILTLGLMR